jgi:glucose/arabinose dehydrogenase
MKWPGVSLALLVTFLSANLLAQGVSVPSRPLPGKPFLVDSAEQRQIRVSVIKGLSHPWSLTFLPSGEMLVTERPGQLRIVRNGVLDPKPIAGVPSVHAQALAGLMDIALHPKFSETRLVYLSFSKPMGGGAHTSALARGRLQGMALVDVREIFVADAVGTGPAAGNPIVFGRDGYLYMGVGGALDDVAQKTNSHFGKIIRLRDDGSAPPDNPFVGQPGSKPEIYTLGHRNMLGLTVHPVTGAIWETENGPLGGDEVNILKPGANYGWPLLSFGRQYSGAKVSNQTSREGFVDPELIWVPSIAVSGMAFYTGDRFLHWKNNLFVGGLQFGGIRGTGQLHRIVFNEKWEEIRREALLVELRQRIRNVRQGPDGLLYVLTDEDDGAILKLEPAQTGSGRAPEWSQPQ